MLYTTGVQGAYKFVSFIQSHSIYTQNSFLEFDFINYSASRKNLANSSSVKIFTRLSGQMFQSFVSAALPIKNLPLAEASLIMSPSFRFRFRVPPAPGKHVTLLC